MVTRLKNVAPVQFAAVSGVLYAILGLVFAVIWLPFAAIVAATGQSAAAHGFGFGLGVLSLVVFPIAYGIMGFVFGLITAFFYNIVAGFTGGIEVTLEAIPTPVTA